MPIQERGRDASPEVAMMITMPRTLADALDAASRPYGSADGTSKAAALHVSRSGKRHAEGAGNTKDSHFAAAIDGASAAAATKSAKAPAPSGASGSGKSHGAPVSDFAKEYPTHGLAYTWPGASWPGASGTAEMNWNWDGANNAAMLSNTMASG